MLFFLAKIAAGSQNNITVLSAVLPALFQPFKD